MRVAIVGALGRMGRGLCGLLENDPDAVLVAAITRASDERVGKKLSDVVAGDFGDVLVSTQGELSVVRPDVIIEFTTPEVALECLERAVALKIPIVIGATGFSQDQDRIVHKAAKSIPLVHAMNYSLGVNVLIGLCQQATVALGEDFDIEIVEAHHNKKADAPSGTAMAIADGIIEKRDGATRDNLVDGRSGRPGARPKNEIGMHAVRMGGVVGDHHVHFGSQYERMELTHRALDRNLFCAGAIKAAKYLGSSGSAPRQVTMQQVLFGEK